MGHGEFSVPLDSPALGMCGGLVWRGVRLHEEHALECEQLSRAWERGSQFPQPVSERLREGAAWRGVWPAPSSWGIEANSQTHPTQVDPKAARARLCNFVLC